MMSLVIVWCSIFSFHVSALTEEMLACSVKGDPNCQVDATFASLSIDEVGVQFVQKKSLSKRSQELQATTTPSSPGWYLAGVDENCTTGCAAVGLQCFESQQKANNGDVDTSAKLMTLMGQVGGNTNAWVCLDAHGNNPDVPSFGPSYCLYSNTSRESSTFDCDQVPIPASENKQRLCYCADSEACTDISGTWATSTGALVLTQTGCSGETDDWAYTVAGDTPSITEAPKGSAITAITGVIAEDDEGVKTLTWSNGAVYTQGCTDISGSYLTSSGVEVLTQTGCSGEAPSWAFVVAGYTPSITESPKGTPIAAITGVIADGKITWSNGAIYTKVFEAPTTTAAAAAAPTTTAAAGGPQSTECSAMIQPMFDQMDANKDGVATKAELRTMLEGMGIGSDESVDGQWALMDMNGDGVTTCAEMESSVMR
mmetsp:Transcript_90960/g.160415  ORF Transcript_90960/g.160415 Transcript_90960/m.160415 type:complete len:427 (-) Transcript_90960:379-1659(-)